MSKRRITDMAFAQILETCRDGASENQIAYTSNMNFDNAVSYLATLTKSDLIEKAEGTPTIFKTTEKGLETLENLRVLQDFISGLAI